MFAWALGWGLLLAANTAEGANVRYVSEASEPFNRRLIAELVSVGFEVERSDDTAVPLLAGSVAVVRATNVPARVEVWLIEGHERLVLASVIERDVAASDDADSTKVAERLRALLQPLADKLVEPAPAEIEQPPTPPTPAPVARDAGPVRQRPAQREHDFRLDVGCAASSQPGGVAGSAIAGIRYRFTYPLASRLFVALPLTSSTLESSGASAEIEARLAGVSAELDMLPLRSDFRLAPAVGGAVAWLRTSGQASAPQVGRGDDAVLAVAFASVSFGYRFAGDLSLVASGLVGAGVPRTDVEFSGTRVGTYGRPLVLGALSLGYDP